MIENNIYDIIIIGSGPAGYTAAIYSSRAMVKTLMISGEVTGGQLMLTSEVENFPGFSKGIMGPALMEEMKQQAIRFQTEIVHSNVDKVDFDQPIKKVFVQEKCYQAKAVIITTGASAKWLGIETEGKFKNKGVSACATCDGFFFIDKDVAVVGGGDSAMEEAIFLTRFAKTVTILNRSADFRASKIMLQRAKDNPKITIMANKQVKSLLGDKWLEKLEILDISTKETNVIDFGGLFIAIGHAPATGIFKDILPTSDDGYLITDGVKTSIDGVFAAGDVSDRKYRQAVTAAGEGCKAALEALHYIDNMDIG